MDSSEAAFLAGIRANPADDVSRLVFSDWLEEHDDERFRWFRDKELFELMGPAMQSPLPRLLQNMDGLDEVDEDQRPDTIEKLKRNFAAAGPSVVPILLERCKSPPDERSWLPFEILTHCREWLAARLPVIHQFHHEGKLGTGEAYTLLARAGEYDPDAVQYLIGQATGRGSSNADAAANALRGAEGFAADVVANRWVPEVEEALREQELDDPSLVATKVDVLSAISRHAPSVVPVLLQALGFPNSMISSSASRCFAGNGNDDALAGLLRNCTAENAFAVIGTAVHNWADWESRLNKVITPDFPPTALVAILENLRHHTPGWANLAPMFRTAVRHGNEKVRKAAIEAIEHAEDPDDASVPTLREGFGDESPEVRTAALDALTKRLPRSRLLRLLIDGLNDSCHAVSVKAVDLAQSLELWQRVVDTLREDIQSGRPEDQLRSFIPLARIAGFTPDLVGVALPLLRVDNSKVRRNTLRVLMEQLDNRHWTGDEAIRAGKKILKTIRSLVDDESVGVCIQATKILANISSDDEDFDRFVPLTKDPEWDIRAAAFYAIARVRSGDTRELKFLERGLRNEDPRIVEATLVGLNGYPDPDADRQLLILRSANHPAPEIREAVWKALSNISDEQKDILPELLTDLKRALQDPKGEVVEAAIDVVKRAKAKAGELAAEIVSLYCNPKFEKTYLIEDLIAETPQTTPHLAKVLESADSKSRGRAIGVLKSTLEKTSPQERGRIAEVVRAHLPRLLATEKGENLKVPLMLAEALGATAASCFSQVERLLEHSNPDVSTAAFRAVGLVGERALVHVPLLQETAGSGTASPAMQAAALASLASLSVFRPELLTSVVRRIDEADDGAFVAPIVERAGRVPEISRPLIEAALRLLAKPDSTNARELGQAIGKIGEPMRPFAREFFEVARRRDDEYDRRCMIEALGELRGAAADALPLLEKQYHREDGRSGRGEVIQAALKIGGPAAARILALGLRDRNGFVRDTAAMHITELDADGALSVLDAICGAIADPKWDNYQQALAEEMPGSTDFWTANGFDRRIFVMLIFEKLGEKARSAVPTLEALLRDRNEMVRSSAATALAQVGGKGVREIFKKNLRHKDASVRAAAADFLAGAE